MNSTQPSIIRELRKKKGIPGTKVASKLGISPQYYYDIERGKKKLSAKMVSDLADILETNTEYLLGRSDDASPEIRQYVITMDGKTELMSSHETKRAFTISDYGSKIFKLNQQRLNIEHDSNLDNESKKIIISSLEFQIESLENDLEEFRKKDDSESSIIIKNNNNKDLGDLLNQQKVIFNGVELKKEDLQRILGFVEGILYKE
ncbi:helix-turn-helix domain-containing protein [Paenibacillus sp. NPDC058177]|uniref:helix-turn-helix domain-containing protein n=1 Tax=Paenibacillus sp. NPDC058177 TaxID=3346369 RepID=UPI0036D801ED